MAKTVGVQRRKHWGQGPNLCRGFLLEGGRLRDHGRQTGLGSSPGASTCFCKSLLLPEPHLPNLYNGDNLDAQSGCEE